MSNTYTIWTNVALTANDLELLNHNVAPARLLFSKQLEKSNLAAGTFDPLLVQADIAFGQPDPKQVIELPNVKWVHLTTAGYTRYNTAEFKNAMKNRGGIFTNSSSVFAEPCAEHVLAMMLSIARQLPMALDDQRRDASWKITEIRAQSHLLEGQTAIIYGMGAIGQRLVELLTPLRMKLTGVRRKPSGKESIATVTPADADHLLHTADHVINILPASSDTEHFFNADRFGKMKHGAIFYNIGRGTTVDQGILKVCLETRKLAAVYLDVTQPEPLPPESLLWRLPHCYITPHTAGGHANELERIVKHFLGNLRRFEKGEGLVDVVGKG